MTELLVDLRIVIDGPTLDRLSQPQRRAVLQGIRTVLDALDSVMETRPPAPELESAGAQDAPATPAGFEVFHRATSGGRRSRGPVPETEEHLSRMPKVGTKVPLADKMIAARLAAEYGQYATAEHLGISQVTVSRWTRQLAGLSPRSDKGPDARAERAVEGGGVNGAMLPEGGTAANEQGVAHPPAPEPVTDEPAPAPAPEVATAIETKDPAEPWMKCPYNHEHKIIVPPEANTYGERRELMEDHFRYDCDDAPASRRNRPLNLV